MLACVWWGSMRAVDDSQLCIMVEGILLAEGEGILLGEGHLRVGDCALWWCWGEGILVYGEGILVFGEGGLAPCGAESLWVGEGVLRCMDDIRPCGEGLLENLAACARPCVSVETKGEESLWVGQAILRGGGGVLR